MATHSLKDYRKLKVLPNDMQGHLEMHERFSTKGLGGRWDEDFDLFKYYPSHPVVFNRVGFYKLGKDVWFEFKLADGSYRAIDYNSKGNCTWFDFQLDIHAANEHPIAEQDWQMLLVLLKRGVLKWGKRYRDEEYRRERRERDLDMRKSFSQMKSRIKVKLDEKRKNKEVQA